MITDILKLITTLVGINKNDKSELISKISYSLKFLRKSKKYYWKTYRKYKRKGFTEDETTELKELREGIVDLDIIIKDLLSKK